ncbi:MAG: hydantoinase B/oxoprolinase family protein [Thermomicrobiales bacterium]|nr:hydantoinase B/oxoprolinase family protein [Thermomicrobiales bacterium]
MTAATLDPFTIEIIKDGLNVIGDEMFVSLQRTSKSPIIYEVLDYCCGITDDRGHLLAQGNGVAGFLGTMTFAVQSVLDKFGRDNLKPGDIFITNDPYTGGGTHLSDVSIVMPIFYGERLVAFSANKAHWTEVGGKDPGSWTTDSTDVFQEGLQFPCVRLFAEGVPNESLFDVIGANVRTPDMSLGDAWAQVASCRLAGLRFQDLCDKHGLPAVQQAIEILLDYGEVMVAQELAKLPAGIYEAEDWIDDDGLTDDPLYCRVKVTVGPDKFIADFTGSAPQAKGPINCTWTGLVSAVRLIFKALTDPHIPANEGTFRALEVICPPGTVLTAERPAPVSTYWETMIFAADLVWKALAPLVPDRLSAGHFLSVCGDVTFTIHPDTGKPAILVEPNAGGWGASIDQDGTSGLVCVGDGETYILPLEVTEAIYGIQVDRYEFNTAPGGEGKYQGGRGLIRDYRILSDHGGFITATFGRHKFLPWGADGGNEGSMNAVQIRFADGREPVTVGKTARYPLQKGDVARLITGCGGGWGDPKERDHDAVRADLRAGLISKETAREVYGLTSEKA